MTVSELIQALKAMPQDLPVMAVLGAEHEPSHIEDISTKTITLSPGGYHYLEYEDMPGRRFEAVMLDYEQGGH